MTQAGQHPGNLGPRPLGKHRNQPQAGWLRAPWTFCETVRVYSHRPHTPNRKGRIPRRWEIVSRLQLPWSFLSSAQRTQETAGPAPQIPEPRGSRAASMCHVLACLGATWRTSLSPALGRRRESVAQLGLGLGKAPEAVDLLVHVSGGLQTPRCLGERSLVEQFSGHLAPREEAGINSERQRRFKAEVYAGGIGSKAHPGPGERPEKTTASAPGGSETRDTPPLGRLPAAQSPSAKMERGGCYGFRRPILRTTVKRQGLEGARTGGPSEGVRCSA